MDVAGRGEVGSRLADVAALGPYFVITTDPANVSDPAWRALPERDPDSLSGLVDAYAERLGTTERRVAASILFQGMAARLWSPVLACAAYGIVPDLSGLQWRWAPGEPVGLRLPDPKGWRSVAPAEHVHRTVVDEQLRPLRATMLQLVRLADGLLWGNASSALVGTLSATAQRPALAAPLSALVRDLLNREPLAGSGSFSSGGSFVRRSCCLYYRVPPGGEMCGDCSLLKR